ncbi:PREDICTED: uncharacterized protein LOC108558153 [Nicrophorus vespilloides]|uniref:Uncharacterized protein LOC108558153 n=1 Tax=Nicrophorus vespilloides TaxID=110193 RepID=A0ABM1M7B4_NICVS|nr:PREDICTED: uncharacterized protein LOC108558153 [Nicrophorus vespilloides]
MATKREFIYTTLVFLLTATCLAPLIFFIYLAIQVVRYFWYSFVCFMHPEVQVIKETSLRSLVDTQRNQGIIAVLQTIKGEPNYEAVKRHLENLIERTDKFGNLVFPNLRQCLVKKYGLHAWQECQFQLDQHLIIAPNTFRGRILSNYNIQECVSETVSKYIPVGISPWQLVIIPSTAHQHYILLKIHHMLLTDTLGVAEMFPLSPVTRTNILPSKSILRNVFKTPEYISTLMERLLEDFNNLWNEFIATYDPLERPELTKSTPNLVYFTAATAISMVSAWKEFKKNYKIIKSDLISQLRFLYYLIKKEFARRSIGAYYLLKSVYETFHPRTILALAMKFSWRFFLAFTIRIPKRFYDELRALHSCLTLQYCGYPNTTVGFIYNYVPLFYHSLKEALYYLSFVVQTPKNVYEELTSSKDSIETVTLCGRKMVSWSDPVDSDFISKLAQKLGVSETEILLTLMSVGIARYLKQVKDLSPKTISVTARNIHSDYIFCPGRKCETIGGVMCIDLPIPVNSNKGDILDHLAVIRKNVQRSLDTQKVTYLLSILQTRYATISKLLPSTLVGVFLRGLSLKYSVSFTELTATQPNISQKTNWGQEIISSIYWTPPQANISISLCVNQFGNQTVLGVMCDAQIAPHHPALARGFPKDLSELANVAGLQM